MQQEIVENCRQNSRDIFLLSPFNRNDRNWCLRNFQSSWPFTFYTLGHELFSTQHQQKVADSIAVKAEWRLTITSIFCCGSWNPWTVNLRSTEREVQTNILLNHNLLHQIFAGKPLLPCNEENAGCVWMHQIPLRESSVLSSEPSAAASSLA